MGEEELDYLQGREEHRASLRVLCGLVGLRIELGEVLVRPWFCVGSHAVVC